MADDTDHPPDCPGGWYRGRSGDDSRQYLCHLTQALGGNYTVVYNGNMVRVDGTDADALGFEPVHLDFPVPTGGTIDEAQVWEALHGCTTPRSPSTSSTWA